MVRTKVEIKPINDKAKRHTTFTKRRQGLFKKATDLCNKCAAEAAIITFSKAGNLYAFGHPAVDTLLTRYRAGIISESANNGVEEHVRGGGITEKNIVPSLTDEEKWITEVMGNGPPAWDVALENLEMSKLDELEAAIKNIKSNVAMRAREMAASGEEKS